MIWYEKWLERTALEFLENRDRDLEVFLDKLHSNFAIEAISEKSVSKVLRDLTEKIEELR
jgi:hypothetical protein